MELGTYMIGHQSSYVPSTVSLGKVTNPLFFPFFFETPVCGTQDLEKTRRWNTFRHGHSSVSQPWNHFAILRFFLQFHQRLKNGRTKTSAETTQRLNYPKSRKAAWLCYRKLWETVRESILCNWNPIAYSVAFPPISMFFKNHKTKIVGSNEKKKQQQKTGFHKKYMIPPTKNNGFSPKKFPKSLPAGVFLWRRFTGLQRSKESDLRSYLMHFKQSPGTWYIFCWWKIGPECRWLWSYGEFLCELVEGDVDMYVYVLILSSCTYVNMYDDIILTTSKYIYIYIYTWYIHCLS